MYAQLVLKYQMLAEWMWHEERLSTDTVQGQTLREEWAKQESPFDDL